jgi:hypothetical protein
MRDRLARVAAMLSLGLTAVLVVRIIAIGKPGVFIILFPALAGSALALWKRGRATLVLSAVLTALTAVVLLIGGVGLLFLPSIVLFAWGAAMSEGRAGKTEPAGGLHTF